MVRSAGDEGFRYSVRFGIVAALLIALTLVLVLYVLPQRYVLSSGFRESGLNVPDPTTPFQLDPVVRTAARPLPAPRAEPQPGPGELLWSDVLPLIGQERFDAAAARFREFLTDHPGDIDVRRELAITLLRADRRAEAADELRVLLAADERLDDRLLLARTLRELERTDAAASSWAIATEARPENPELWLEWARTYAWVERYAEASDVLERALRLHPGSVPLRVEMARARFAVGDLEGARGQLTGLDDAVLREQDALPLRHALAEAIAVPEAPPPAPPPTLLERAMRAREADDFSRSLELIERALAERPDDRDAWRALADLREYELNDFDGARTALLEVERLRAGRPGAPVDTEPDANPAPDPSLQLRLARLEAWTGHEEEARERLVALLPEVGGGGADASVSPADVQALLGDLERWAGNRPAAAARYDAALSSDAANERASLGLDSLEAVVHRLIVAEERPGLAYVSQFGADTDDFLRMDVGGQWIRVTGDWAFGGAVGSRWIDGVGLRGGAAAARQGFFTDLEATRWWRWGTVRTGVEVGLQEVADGIDPSVALSVGHRAGDGSRTDVRYEHGPAYLVTTTLQSLLAGVAQDVLRVSWAGPSTAGWEVTSTGGLTLLSTPTDAPAAGNDRTVRADLTASLARRMTETLALGVTAGALGFTDPAPVFGAGPGTDRRVFWDPRLALSVQPFLRVRRDLSPRWSLTGRLGAGAALIDERTTEGWDVAPQLSLETGIRREGARYRVSLDLFTSQGRFDGYRQFGARLSIGGPHLPRSGGDR